MNFDLDKHTIYLCKHGSQAYGTNTKDSDLDIKGVCIEPKEYHYGFLHNFEQYESMKSKDGGDDKVVYSLKKFAKLAADNNPNIIEILHVDKEDVLYINAFGEELLSYKDDFLCKRARFSFAGYAHAQAKRIKTHRNWLLNPPKECPTRKQFKLGETTKVSASHLGAFDAMVKNGGEDDLPKDILALFLREKQYQAAKKHWDQYVNWKKTRNPARAELEAKYGLDVKHASHLIRLLRVCKEILTLHKVIVKRPDREELLDIRNGKWSYEKIMDHADALEKECDELYITSTLRKEPDRVKIDKMVVDITERFLSNA